jgi:hypothetical protein
MNSENPLVPVYRAFSVASDCFRVAARTFRAQREELIGHTQFFRASPEEVTTALAAAESQAADLAILALFATFERFVIEHLQAANRLLAVGYPRQYSVKLAEKFESVVEYWRFVEILDLFRAEVDPALIGRVKQIKQYRDWIAHQNPNKSTSTRATPDTAFEVLSEMIEQIRLTHTPREEEEVVEVAACE